MTRVARRLAERTTLRVLAVALPLVGLIAPTGTALGQVRFERTGFRLTSIGERLQVSGRIVDSRRRPIASASIRWRIADPSIATVTPQGVVVSRKVGYTKLWAVTGRDSASALILVDQWAATFDFNPSIVRFDAIGARTNLRVQVRDAGGHLITDDNRRAASCRSLNDRVATLGTNGELQSIANGVTYVRCTDRGVADSVRVEVRQRAVRASIADKLSFGTKVVGDTFRIAINAFDRAGDELNSVQGTWASLSPAVVGVDPLTGFARSLAPGTAKVVGQVGDVTDTLTVQVALAPGMPVPVVSSADSVGGGLTESIGPALEMQAMYLAEGDSGTVSIVARDALGGTVANPDVRLQSTDTSVVAVLSRGRVVARQSGQAYIVGEFGALRDSMLVSVRIRASVTAAGATAAAANAAPFVRPRFAVDSATAVYRARLDSARNAIRQESVVAEYRGQLIALTGTASQTFHWTRLSSAIVEDRSGLMYGGVAEIAPHRTIRLTAAVRTGMLVSSSEAGEDLKLTEGEADLTFMPTAYFGVRGGYVIRSYASEIATQQWRFPRASLVSRFPFVGGAVTPVIGFSLHPAATFTGYRTVNQSGDSAFVNPETFSVGGEAGLEFSTRFLNAGITYYVERFKFPDVAGVVREDMLSTIRIRVGLQGRR